MDAKSLSDIWRLLQCPQCLQCPMTAPVYMCESGHHMCANCSQRIFVINGVGFLQDAELDSTSREVPCFNCGERMTLMRNTFCEKLIKIVSSSTSMPDVRCVPLDAKKGGGVYTTIVIERKPSLSAASLNDEATPIVDETPTPKGSAPSDVGDSKLPRQNDTTNLYRNSSFETRSSHTGSFTSVSYCDITTSKKRMTNHMPIRCPKIPCGKTIAASGLILHFHFDHKDVPHIDLTRNDELNVWITPTVIPFEIERCLALVILQEERSQLSPGPKTSLPFLLMGTRLPCHLNTSMQLHRVAISDYPLNGDCLLNDFLLVWIIGLETRHFSCRMVATDVKDNSRSLTYFGPIVSVRDIFSPREILGTGNCLVVPPGLVNVLTESGGGFDVNITIL